MWANKQKVMKTISKTTGMSFKHLVGYFYQGYTVSNDQELPLNTCSNPSLSS